MHVIFEPVDFIAKLAVLVPKPKGNLTRFHGVFAPNSKHRALVTPAKRGKGSKPKVADGQRNGVIKDPGGVGVSPPSATDTSGGGSSGGSGGSGGCVAGTREGVDPLLPLLLLWSMIGLMYRSRGHNDS